MSIEWNAIYSSYNCILAMHIMSRNETRACNPRLQKSANIHKVGTCRSLFVCNIKEIGRGCDKSATATRVVDREQL